MRHDAALVEIEVRLDAVGDFEETGVAAGLGRRAFGRGEVVQGVGEAEVGAEAVVAVRGAGRGEWVRARVDGAGCWGGGDLGERMLGGGRVEDGERERGNGGEG